MKKYELLLVLPGTLDEMEAKTRSNEVIDLVKEFSQDVEIDEMGKNRLAYPIKHIRYGYFYTIVFSAETDGLKKLQDKLTLQRDLLRSIISMFNIKVKSNKRFAYTKNEIGAVQIEKKEEKKESKAKSRTDDPKESSAGEVKEVKIRKKLEKKVDLSEIDKKLDEILENDSIKV